MAQLSELADYLRAHPAIREKATIRNAYQPAQGVAGNIALGDDAAAIPDGSGWLLMAGEAMLPDFAAKDPWFAGYCAVMVNISDIAAMGGRPIAIVDLLWKSDEALAEQIWVGMQAASEKYQVPIVGGHTSNDATATALGATILGRAKQLLTSFDAEPGDTLLMAVDMRAQYRNNNPFWNASVDTEGSRLRDDLELLPQIAEAGLCKAAKDISNGGILGTLMMFLECSQVGAQVNLDALPMPPDNDLQRWLIAFPSFGYLLAVNPKDCPAVIERFTARSLVCQPIGHFHEERSLSLSSATENTVLWRNGAITTQ